MNGDVEGNRKSREIQMDNPSAPLPYMADLLVRVDVSPIMQLFPIILHSSVLFAPSQSSPFNSTYVKKSLSPPPLTSEALLLLQRGRCSVGLLLLQKGRSSLALLQEAI
ncbi:unnamed protein product [Arctogadus glacialis]